MFYHIFESTPMGFEHPILEWANKHTTRGAGLKRWTERKMVKKGVPMWTKRVMAEFEKQGVKVFRFPEEERVKWTGLVSDTSAEWAGEVSKQGHPGWEIIERYQQPL